MVELQGLSRTELNGQRGVSLGTLDLTIVCRVSRLGFRGVGGGGGGWCGLELVFLGFRV